MKDKKTSALYFPPALIAAVSAITRAPLTLITAGSGFGKTTVVSTLLERVPRETVYRWYTCFGEPPERAWEGLCRLIGYADKHTGEFLSRLELPSADHLGYISSLMEELSCQRETILVIDNFQLTGFPAPYRLLDALAAHRCEKLHLVVLSHPVYTGAALAVSNPRIRQITQNSFCFAPKDVQKLFALWGAPVDEAAAARLCGVTEGWVAALRLHLSSYLAGGALGADVGMGELMEQAFWRRLGEREQSLFLGLSLLDTFTEAQAARMLGRDVLPEEVWAAVWKNAFVRRAGNEYSLHNLLREFLLAKLPTQSEAAQKRLQKYAGTACQLQGKNVEALLHFATAGDDVSALSVPLSSLQLAELVRTKAPQLEALLSRCRRETLGGRWLLLLGTAVKSSLNGKASLAQTAVMRLMELRDSAGGDDEQRACAAAALALVASFRAYNDLAEMCRCHAATIALLPDARDFYLTNDSWTFCIPSVVYMFWRESGKLRDTVELLQSGIPNYALLSGGKGLGGPEVMDAEARLSAGDEAGAQNAAFLSRTLARKDGQDSILFCVYTLLGRLALLRGDAEAFNSAVRDIERHAFEGREFLCVTASEVALGYLYSLLDVESKIPGWLLREETVRQSLYPISAPFALVVALRHIRKTHPEELLGTAEAFIRETDAMRHLLPRLYFLLEEAALLEQNGRRPQALEKLAEVLSLALPDRLYLPVAEYYAELAEALSAPELICGDNEALEAIRSMGRRFINGAATVRAAVLGLSPLTPREREIAILARDRLSTQEIADKLVISPATVKNTLSKVYSKLGIAGKSELEGRQF